MILRLNALKRAYADETFREIAGDCL